MSGFAPVQESPKGIVSRVRFSLFDPSYLLASSWDGNLRVYNFVSEDPNQNRLVFDNSSSAPILDTIWDPQRNTTVFYGGVENRVYELDLETRDEFVVGNDHSNAVSSLVYHQPSRSLISGSWDKTLRQLDPRDPGNHSVISLPGKVVSMDASGDMLVVGMTQRLVSIYDMRNLTRPVDERTSSLRKSTRTVKTIPDGSGYIITSVDGRVSVEFFDKSPQVQSMAYAFKGHKLKDNFGRKVSTPINAVAFHPKYSTFFTGGGDSNLVLWDIKARTRRKVYPKFDLPVMCIDVSESGDLVAVGLGSDTIKGEDFWSDFQKSGIFIRRLEPSECKGRT